MKVRTRTKMPIDVPIKAIASPTTYGMADLHHAAKACVSGLLGKCVDSDAEYGSRESMCVKHCVLFDVRNEH